MSDIPFLVDAQWLIDNRDRVKVIDATTFLDQPEGDGYYDVSSGRAAYREAHVPGAVFADLLVDLADQDAPTTFTVLPSEEFARTIGDLGISNDDHVVVYDQGANIWAARLWWNFRLEGFDRVSLLDRGIEAWKEAGQPLASGEETLPPAQFVARRRPERLADAESVLAAIDDDATLLINSLDEATFRGDRQTYARPGRIPGSVNVSFWKQFDDQGRAADIDTIRRSFESVGALDPSVKPVTYCGSGIAASYLAFNLARLGREDVAVYDGSLTEWAADERLPLEVG
ncbi:sulfurtransferase [uncultured Aeromicrobium sp.]|uniref:sulfurtransferase n=1 Tax=uncultured Aeromicrobium sp. TaxID=337820 RepID=UPI0025D5522A|nr:sulfurtransferase [uncultured Aeromicrobium sp.]